MKTQDLLIPALAFMAGAFYAKRNNKVSGIGAAEIIDSNEESLRLAVQLGYFDLSDRDMKLAMDGSKEIYKKMHQHLMPDSTEQKKELTEEVNKAGGTWFVNRIHWILNGSYGAEVKYYINRLLTEANTKGIKSFERSLNSIAVQVSMILFLYEFTDLNRAAIVAAIKKAEPKQNELLLYKVKQEIIDFYLQYVEENR